MKQFLLSLKKRYIALFFIVLLAAIIRFWNLSIIPPSASLDESSIGWNAYSVLQTGKDEYEQFPLISQRGYDDWRRSTYLFLTIPPIAAFGLSAFAERLPAATLSVLTVFLSFFIVRMLFKKQSSLSIGSALLTAFLLAISPWHVYISRLGHESNACLSFMVFGMFFFLLGLQKKKFALLITAGIFFTLSMISYYSGQIFIPILLLVLCGMYRKPLQTILFANKKTTVIFILLFLLFMATFANVFSPSSLIRFQGTSTFTPTAHPDLYKEMVMLRNNAVRQKNILGSLVFNRRVYPVVVFVEGYISHFDPRWLFFNSYQDPFKAPNMGLLYVWELPFILLGMFLVFSSKELPGTSKVLIFLWFFLGPLPAAVATQAPHAMRAYNVLPMWQLFTAVSLVYLYYAMKNFRIVWLVFFGLVIVYSLSTFYRNYFVFFPKEESEPYQYAMRDVVAYINQHSKDYTHIVVSNQNNLYQSYMFYLFYTKYNPKKYQDAGGTISGGFNQTHTIGTIDFRPIQWNKEQKGTLLVGNVNDFPKNNTPVLFTSYYLDGSQGVVIKEK